MASSNGLRGVFWSLCGFYPCSAYHATVLAGVRVGEESMVGAVAVATRDVRPYHVNLGIPAKSVRVKPNAPTEGHVTLDSARQREVTDS